METLKHLFQTSDLPTIILFGTVLMLVLVLIKWHTDNSTFDFRRALIDPATKEISFSRLGHFVCLVVSTGIILHAACLGRLTEWMYSGYMFAWAGAYVVSKAIDVKRPYQSQMYGQQTYGPQYPGSGPTAPYMGPTQGPQFDNADVGDSVPYANKGPADFPPR